MSQPRGFGLNGKSIYVNIAKPTEIELNFTVDHANGNGLGVRSIKSNGYVQNVFMNTSATPGVGNGGIVNPNPIAGYILIQFKNNFNVALSGSNSIVSPLSGSPVTSTTAGHAYVIVSLGTATAAQWTAAGVPAGLTASVGMAFIAKQTASIGGSAAVEVPSFSNVGSIETVGDPNQSISVANIATNGGAWLLLQCVSSATGSSALATPADNSVIALRCRFDASTVGISDGGPSNSGPGPL